jgi:hypothetical protein
MCMYVCIYTVCPCFFENVIRVTSINRILQSHDSDMTQIETQTQAQTQTQTQTQTRTEAQTRTQAQTQAQTQTQARTKTQTQCTVRHEYNSLIQLRIFPVYFHKIFSQNTYISQRKLLTQLFDTCRSMS